MYTLPLHAATSVVANNALPTLPMVNGQIKDGYGFVTGGNNTNIVTDGLQMNITQNDSNAAIKWGSFDVGGSATVNFDYTGKSDFNTLNYVNSASASQIYGTINAQHEGYNGNIFVINPAGVQIGPSAQINVGSLYVSNKYLNENKLAEFDGSNINSLIDTTKTANAELMSLGNINAANNVTFDGNRIVLDTDRVIFSDEENAALNIRTTDTNNVVLGYEAYNEKNGYKDTVDNEKSFDVTKVTIEDGNINEENANVKGYMWVEDVEQLQAINTNLGGNYALRNSIDATSTEQKNFISIGSDGNEFTGKFDGIDYNIFGLTINSNKSNTGLFGETNGATINNVTLVGGKITGVDNTGALVGHAINSNISNVVNSAEVNGNRNVGGLIGAATNSTVENAVNTGTIHSDGGSDNHGDVVSSVGGLIGSMYNNSTLDGNSYNLGDVSGDGYNVGGLVGHAVNSTIGDGTNLVYNRLDVTGKYNVGGIVGNMDGTTVQNAENSGNVTATGHTTGEYTYHTGETVLNNIPNGTLNGDGTVTTSVNVANVGGIAGTASNNSTIENVTNTADISSNSSTYWQNKKQNIYYTAGNVGGIVGRAENTDINNATNKENTIRGAHNVGGVAGYFGNTDDADKIYTVNTGINDGGDIMATGARNSNGFVKELVRPVGDSNESFIIGNIGGIVGYMNGDDVFVTASGNRGTVHSQDIAQEDAENVLDTSKAANVGGVVGKIDRSDTEDISTIKQDETKAAVSNSYNTGDVRGYTGVGGVVGMMYNGEVAGSYNLGNLRTTRIATNSPNIEAVNMGGIVGDTTEGSRSQGAVIYDVYNKGQIGDDTYTYYARHVAGIVGRLSGEVEKAYNNGEIYNGYTATGGIAGWMYEGSIKNAFNTGNITVYNHDSSTSQVGGIVGAASVGSGNINLTNVYNLGTLRSFEANQQQAQLSHAVGDNAIGGIIGAVMSNSHSLNISGAYTTGNIYAGIEDSNGDISLDKSSKHIGSISGENRNNADINRTNTYYIKPQTGIGFTELGTNNYGQNNSNKAIDYNSRYDENEYKYDNSTGKGSLNFSTQSGGNVTGDTDDNWRLYGDTPILNAFLPDSEKYFDQYGDDSTLKYAGMDKVQYGTAYDPLLTIVTANENANGNLSFNFGNDDNELSISNAAGLVVNGAGVTINNFTTSGGSGYFGGLLYSEGVLTINAAKGEGLGLGSASQIYGSSVTLTADGTITVYGDVVATGNETQTTDNPDEAGSINITSNKGDVNVYGTLTSAQAGENVVVPGISATADSDWKPADSINVLNNPKAHLNTIGDRFEVNTDKSNVSGNINITAKGVKDEKGELISGGNVNLYYGNKEEGLITTGGDLTVTGEGDVYVDSDLDIGGNLTLEAGAGNEALLDITNIGQVQNNHDNEKAKETLHNFLDHFANGTGKYISFGNTTDAKITVDMWNVNTLDLSKFDYNGKTLVSQLNDLNVDSAVNKTAKQLTHIWVNNGEQLKNIQTADDKALDYNFALKGDINASDVENYVAIGTGSNNGFTGTFDGRGNRIIGLTVDKVNGQSTANAGIFSTIGEGGTVKNVNIYSGNFEGTNTAGAVAGVNKGSIENVVTFGNRVEAHGSNNSITINDESVGAAGGIAGINDGYIYDVGTTGTVIAGSAGTGSSALSTAGGIVGINGLNNNEATVDFSYSDSAVTASDNSTYGLGGVAGVNNGTLSLVDSLGVTRGLYVDQNGNYLAQSGQVGGIVGINNNTINSGYNESIVTGLTEVGGIAGVNVGNINSVVNAVSVTGDGKDIEGSQDKVAGYYVGGLVGTNNGSVTDGRNNGTITGNEYVGGMVGSNANGSTLNNLINGESADIIGENYVGGIAGKNSGSISANDSNLENRGSITGQNYVGGVAGLNTDTGSITNTNNDVSLNVKDSNKTAQYFGGVVGKNEGKIEKSTNSANIVANGATYVGGITGHNTGNLVGMGNSNKGNVVGKDYVGGVIGWNEGNIGSSSTTVEIVNSGIVEATAGGAGGLIAYNKGDLTNVEMTNAGKVTGTATNGTSGTGGLIGYNEGDITGSVLENTVGFVSDGVTLDGDVTGLSNVGGVIGVNTGKIENTSLMNKADITVTVGENQNAENIGGLIGKNIGEIEGGRIEADGKTDAGYYKYQIYNNGTITVTGEGENIGGLIGYNTVDNTDPDNIKTGSLTAGYNTGAIKAENSSNVGGIVGKNEGIVDQVFNTVMTGVDNEGKTVYGTITGKDNVGGLVGTNSGTLSNAYNTTAVNGAVDSTGVAVGVNINKVENIYGYSELVGNGNEATNSYVINNSDEWKQQEKYIGFDFTTSDNTPAIWKNYDGYGNPLLKVFLTKAGYKGDEKFTYNATDQGLTINSNTITAADELDAYKNANSLLTATQNKNAGEGYLGIYSQQIAASGKGDAFDPNNLGYDIDVTYDIKKKQLNITLDDVHRVYGNVAITQGGYQISNIDGWQGNDKDLANGITISPANDKDSFEETDTALTGNSTGKVTENAGGQYTWSADVTLSEEIAQNYEITTTTLTGNSYVGKAKLTININDVTMTYGDKESTISNQYGYTVNNCLVNGDSLEDVIADMNYNNTAYNTDGTTKDVIDGKYALEDKDVIQGNKYGNYEVTINDGEVTMGKAQLVVDINNVDMTYGDKESTISNQYGYTVNNGLVNEDSLEDVIADMTYENTAYNADGTTKDVIYGKYALENKDITVGGKYGNYEVTINNGTVMMNKADLNIKVDNANTTVGKMPGELTGTVEGLTNGDTLPTHDFALKDDSLISVSGNHEDVIGIVIGGKFYELGDADWSNGLFANYDVNYEMGDLAVSVVEIPDNWPNNRWDYLFADNPFDRNENFRERKAEVNFVDGAMEI